MNRAFLFLSSALIFKFGSLFFCSVLILVGIQVEVMVWAQNTLWLVTRVLVCLHIENVCSSVCPVSDTLQRLCPTKLIATCVFSFVWPTSWSLLLFLPFAWPTQWSLQPVLVTCYSCFFGVIVYPSRNFLTLLRVSCELSLRPSIGSFQV